MEFFRDFVPPSTKLPNPDPYHRAQEKLNLGDILFSATRSFQLILQTDGNLVLYCIDDGDLPVDITKGTYSRVIWASGTNGLGAKRCNMQDDGNLVIYDGSSKALWESASDGNPGAILRCQDDGNLVIYAPGGTPLWNSNTFAGSRGGASGGGIISQGGGHGGGGGGHRK
jgi:hypothetical protein